MSSTLKKKKTIKKINQQKLQSTKLKTKLNCTVYDRSFKSYHLTYGIGIIFLKLLTLIKLLINFYQIFDKINTLNSNINKLFFKRS